MDLQESVTLTDSNGGTVTLPLENVLRLFMVKVAPFIIQYQQETGNSDIAGFYEWFKKKINYVEGRTLL